MAVIITSDQEFPVAISFTDNQGNPASVNGVPVWDVSDLTIITISPADDGLSAVVSPVGPDGFATVTVTANVNMDPQGDPVLITGTLEIVVSGQAATVVMTPGTPVPIS